MNTFKKKILPLLLILLLAIAYPVYSRLAGQEVTDAATEEVSSVQEVITDSPTDETEELITTSAPQAPPEETTQTPSAEEKTEAEAKQPGISEDGRYDSKDEVALYIKTYGHLPSNYITKKQANALGWSGGSLEEYAPGCSIGGDHFGNYEGLLPKKSGRTWTECDIGTAGRSSRGAKRIVFSNDGLIYYTDDHYESFTQIG